MSAKENADYLMTYAQAHGITDPKELANFMGQMQVECGGFGRMNENLNYSGDRLLAVFPGRNGMDTLAEANRVAAGGEEGVANQIYGGAWGKRNLGNTEPGDGWTFHGRGYVQLTGRDNYEAAGKALGLDLVNHPELASNQENAAKIAVYYWNSRVQANGHQQNVHDAAVDINGGTNGLPERRTAAAAWEAALDKGYKPGGPEPIPGGAGGGGHSRESVRHVQELLNKQGYHDSNGKPLGEDGRMGAQTKGAIEAFQRDHGLKADGVAGPATLKELEKGQPQQGTTAKPATTPPAQPAATDAKHTTAEPKHAATPATLREGSRGDDVHSLQASLAAAGYKDANGKPIKADGDFGAHTKEALQSFQRDRGLKDDGIAGKATFAALQSKEAAAPRMDQAGHPDNPLYRQALDNVQKLDAQAGRASDQYSSQFAGSLATAARAQGMTGIDHVTLSNDGSRAWAVQGELNSPFKQMAEVQTQQAVNTPLEQSTRQAEQHAQNAQQSQQTQQAQQAQLQAQQPPQPQPTQPHGP
ncbi:peptidoglycan-binding protein [Bacillus sp. NP157]|nr:peptidoglycan-binding protein [Bacillus sp. NP157]